jgi:hypothetical protein
MPLLIELHHYHHDTVEQEAETLLQDKQMPQENILSLHLSDYQSDALLGITRKTESTLSTWQ